MNRIKTLLLIAVTIVCLTLTILSFGKNTKEVKDSASTAQGSALSSWDVRRLTNLIDVVKKYYYSDIDSTGLFKRAVSGMLSSLDPHSEYLEGEDLKDLEMVTSGRFGGIGVEVYPDHGAILVVSPLDDTPAYKAGIKAGDYIVQINKKLVRDMTLGDAVNMMRGPSGSRISLTVIRKNTPKPLLFNLKRETIRIKTVKSRMLEPGYGYVRLVAFQEPTEHDMLLAIRRLSKLSGNKLKGLILDMRNNPGGLVEAAIRIADDFLDSRRLGKNELIVYAKGRGESMQIVAKATPGCIVPKIPIVVLINEGSASAAEIVAGALQDHKRAIIVGKRSFGKGSVQTLITIDKKSAIKLTTAIYYTPFGRSIQAKGIEPDINIEDMQVSSGGDEIPRIDEAALLDHIRDGGDNDDGIVDKKTSKDKDAAGSQQKLSKTESELARKDYQLYEALHILKSQNVMLLEEDQDSDEAESSD